VSGSRKLLIFGGIALAAIGMSYGLYYAVFAEHQALDGMGASLTEAFVTAAERDFPQSNAAIDAYTRTKFVYLRDVDVHSHWIGLAMILIVLGTIFDRVSFADGTRLWLAISLFTGAVIFPFGVLLQTMMPGPLPSALAIAGSTLMIGGLILTAAGFARTRT
jgi:hypothetical protein